MMASDRPPTPPSTSRTLAALALGLVLLTTPHGNAPAQITQRTVSEPGPADELKGRRQREFVDELARRRLGTRLRGNGLDLDTLQRLLDEGHVRKDDVFAQQALGLVLGDVMVSQLRLHWVVVDDHFGHSRGLRWRESQQLFFPITMISKRVSHGERVSMRALYASVEQRVRVLRARP
jgi:hypothetical protein